MMHTRVYYYPLCINDQSYLLCGASTESSSPMPSWTSICPVLATHVTAQLDYVGSFWLQTASDSASAPYAIENIDRYIADCICVTIP
jgi:hypothetical protein